MLILFFFSFFKDIFYLKKYTSFTGHYTSDKNIVNLSLTGFPKWKSLLNTCINLPFSSFLVLTTNVEHVISQTILDYTTDIIR